MSKKVKVDSIQPEAEGPIYGRVSNPSDFMKSQIYAHGHSEVLARDFVVGNCASPAVEGFALTLEGGRIVRIHTPGHIVGVNGKSYELVEADFVQLEAEEADADFPRIDLMVAVLEADIDAAEELRPFARLRTLDEQNAGVAPYPPLQFEQPTEQHTRATVQIRTGTPSSQPASPALAANELPLYSLTLDAGATAISEGSVRDLRHHVASNCELQDMIIDLQGQIKLPPKEHEHTDSQIILGPAVGSKWQGKRQAELNAFLLLQGDDDDFDPLTRPETLTSDGKLGAVGAVESGTTPVVDIPASTPKKAAFSDRVITLEPGIFPAGSNARYVNTSGTVGVDSRENDVDFSLAVVDAVTTDGGGTFELKNFSIPIVRARAYLGGKLTAPRDGRYIELMGGGTLDGDAGWYTVDTQTGTVQQRAFTGDLPFWAIRAVLPCGDGTHVLVAQQAGADGGINGGKLEWFKVNCVTTASVKFSTVFGTAPGSTDDDTPSTNPTAVVGDLIAPNLVFIIINTPGIAAANGRQVSSWFYHVDSNTFELLNPTGTDPLSGLTLNTALQDVDLCLYQSGKAVLVRGKGIQTHIFDAATRSWTKLQIAQPRVFENAWTSDLWGCTVANINGRVLMTSETSNIWELTPSATAPQWDDIGLPAGLGAAPSGGGIGVPNFPSGRGFCGLVGMISSGIPNGGGWLIGGRVANSPKKDVWQFIAAGIIETQLNGVTGITLAPGVMQATFTLKPDLLLDWAVDKLLASLTGFIPTASVSMLYSLDGGLNWQQVVSGKLTSIVNSSNPALRRLRITLTSSGSSRPVLTHLHEQFQKTGTVSLNSLFIRYNAPLGTKGLYLNRDGTMEFSAAIVPTTIDKAILVKSTHNGGGLNPTVKNYINQRLIIKRFNGAKPGGGNPTFNYDGAVAPRYVDARGVAGGATGSVYKIAEPAIAFDQDNIAVPGLTSTGDNYFIEVFA